MKPNAVTQLQFQNEIHQYPEGWAKLFSEFHTLSTEQMQEFFGPFARAILNSKIKEQIQSVIPDIVEN